MIDFEPMRIESRTDCFIAALLILAVLTDIGQKIDAAIKRCEEAED